MGIPQYVGRRRESARFHAGRGRAVEWGYAGCTRDAGALLPGDAVAVPVAGGGPGPHRAGRGGRGGASVRPAAGEAPRGDRRIDQARRESGRAGANDLQRQDATAAVGDSKKRFNHREHGGHRESHRGPKKRRYVPRCFSLCFSLCAFLCALCVLCGSIPGGLRASDTRR